MGNISRILAVVTALLCLAFFGFALVTTKLGGPNWQTEAARLKPTGEDPHGYVFTRTLGENPQWTATSASGEFSKSAAVLPDVIVAAYDHKIQSLQAQLNALSDEQPQLEQRKEALQAAISADEAALQQAVAERDQFLAQLREQYQALSQQVVQKTEEGQRVEQIVDDRRTDVFRLENQLEVLKADNARVNQIEQQMVDLIRQIDADLEKAERRGQQLKSRLGDNGAPVVQNQNPPGQ